MPLLITLDIFSGRENPSFVLADGETQKILPSLEENRKSLAALPRPSILGYRGFRVTHIGGQDVPTPAPFAESEASLQVYNHPEIEKRLIELSGQALGDDDLQALLYSEFERTSTLGWKDFADYGGAKCPPCNAADAPAYNPAFWNTPARQPYNNCYNYANNQATNTFAQPGRATGHPMTGMTCSGVQPSAQSDGLQPSGGFADKLPPGKGWYVALVIWPGRDYHWYRQDNVGCWSHKPGQTAARNTDSSGNPILDPRTCDRGPYTDFCTYMITGNWVTIQ